MVSKELQLLLKGDAKSFIDALTAATHNLDILRGGMAKSGASTEELIKQTDKLGIHFQNLIKDAWETGQAIDNVAVREEFLALSMGQIGSRAEQVAASKKKLNAETHVGIGLAKEEAQIAAEKYGGGGGGIQRLITDTMLLIETIQEETAANQESTQNWGLKFDRIAKLRGVYKGLGADTAQLDQLHSLLSNTIHQNIDNWDEETHSLIEHRLAMDEAAGSMQAYHDHVSPIAKATRAASEEFLDLANAVLVSNNSIGSLDRQIAALTIYEQKLTSMTAESTEQKRIQNAELRKTRSEQAAALATRERVLAQDKMEAFSKTKIGQAAAAMKKTLDQLNLTRETDIHMGDAQVKTLEKLKLEFMELVTSTNFATEADRLHMLQMLKTMGVMQQMEGQMQRAISWDARAAVGTKKAELAKKGYTKATGRLNAAISNASFGVQDFITVLQGGGGLERAILSTTNNIGMMASLLVGGWKGAIIGVGAALGSALVPILKDWMGFTEEQTENLEDQVSALDQWNASAQRRIDLIEQKLALAGKDLNQDLGESPLEGLEQQDWLDANTAIRQFEQSIGGIKTKINELDLEMKGLEWWDLWGDNPIPDLQTAGDVKRIGQIKEEMRLLDVVMNARIKLLEKMRVSEKQIDRDSAVQRDKDLNNELSDFILSDRQLEFHELRQARIAADAANEEQRNLVGYLDRKTKIQEAFERDWKDLHKKHEKEDAERDQREAAQNDAKLTRHENDLRKLKDNLRKGVQGEREAAIAKIDIWAEEQTKLLELATTRGQVTRRQIADIKSEIKAKREGKIEDVDKKIDSAEAKRKMDVHDEINDILDSEHKRRVRALQDQKDNLAARAREEGIGGARLIAAMKAVQDQIDALNKEEEDKKKPAGQPDTFEERLDKINAQRAATGQAPIHAGSKQGRAIQRQVGQEQKDFGAQQREAGKGMGGRIKKWSRYFESQGGMGRIPPGMFGAGMKRGGQRRFEGMQGQFGDTPGGARGQAVVGAGAVAAGGEGTGLADMIPLLGLNQQTNQMNNQMLQTIIDEIDRLKANALKDQQDQRKIKKNLRSTRRAGRN